MKAQNTVPAESVNRFFQSVEARAWTDAEKELDVIRQNSQNAPWYKGYVKGLEGLLLTYRSNDDKYIYLPKALTDRTEESVNTLRKEFGEFASNEIHGEYDRGYFKALEDYVTALPTVKPPNASPPREREQDVKKEATSKANGLTPYIAGSS